MHSRALVLSAVVLFAGCNGITYPTQPTTTPPPSGPQPTNLVVTATPDRLPHTGGEARIVVRAIRRENGAEIAVPGVAIKMSSTEGTLSAADVTSDDEGQAQVTWTTTRTGIVIARAGLIDGNVTIALDGAPLPPAPPSQPTPTPTPPAPIPTPPPSPSPAPQPLDVTLTPSPAPATVGQPVTWTATATIPASEGTARLYEWSFDGEPLIVTGQSVMSQTYRTSGTHNASVTVRSTTWASGTATGSVTVNPVPPPPPPALSLTLTATPTNGASPLAVDFTAAASGFEAGETVTVYQWDLDGNGTFEFTSTVGTRQHTFTTGGVYTAKVKILTSSDRTAEATQRVIVTN